MNQPLHRRVNVWALLVVAVVVLGIVVWQQRKLESESTGRAAGVTSDANDTCTSSLAGLLSDLVSAWDNRNRDAFIAAAGTSSVAKSWGARTYDNLEELSAKSIGLEVLHEPDSGLRVDGTCEADIGVSWVPGAKSDLPTNRTDTNKVHFRVRPGEDGYAIEGASATRDPMPVWLAGSLDATQHGRRTVVRVDGGSEEPRMSEMMRRAMTEVRRVYGKPASDAFVVLPSETSQASDIVGGSDQRLGRIAAITTTLDGAGSSGAPVAVVLNPKVFTPMKPRAAQLVLTHEVTHDVTGATTATAPRWVTEGYADYVALSRDRLEPTRSASRILRRVRRTGAPTALPADARFNATSPRLGATYEGAWMAFRMLGETYGDDTVTEFYRKVLAGRSVDVAAQRVFGLRVADITERWRDYLRHWAAE